jgi:hypothetical protein
MLNDVKHLGSKERLVRGAEMLRLRAQRDTQHS